MEKNFFDFFSSCFMFSPTSSCASSEKLVRHHLGVPISLAFIEVQSNNEKKAHRRGENAKCV